MVENKIDKANEPILNLKNLLKTYSITNQKLTLFLINFFNYAFI